jgi:hypothetical protein
MMVCSYELFHFVLTQSGAKVKAAPINFQKSKNISVIHPNSQTLLPIISIEIMDS